MITNSPAKVETLARHGIQVAGIEEIRIEPGKNSELRKTLEGKIKDGHFLKLD